MITKSAPAGPPPVSREVVEIVTKRKSAPKAPPPSGMTAFRAPKSVNNSGSHSHQGSRIDEEDENDDDDNQDYAYSRSGNPSSASGENLSHSYSSHRASNSHVGGAMGAGAPGGPGGHVFGRMMDSAGYSNHPAQQNQHQQQHGRGYSAGNGAAAHEEYDDGTDSVAYDNGDRSGGGAGGGQYHNHQQNQQQHHIQQQHQRQQPSYPPQHPNSHPHQQQQQQGGGQLVQPQPKYAHLQSQNSNSNQQQSNGNGQQQQQQPQQFQSLAGGQSGNPVSTLSPRYYFSVPNSRCRLYNFAPLLKATYRELRHFVNTPCDIGLVTRCYIERNRSGMANMLSPVYSLCADLEDGTGRELIVCRKVMTAMTSYYTFSLKHEDLYRSRDQRSSLYLGKLRKSEPQPRTEPGCSYPECEYVLYDTGATPAGNSTGTSSSSNSSAGEPLDENPNSFDPTLYRKVVVMVRYNNLKRPTVVPGGGGSDGSNASGYRGMEVGIKVPHPPLVVGAGMRSGSTGIGESDEHTKRHPSAHVTQLSATPSHSGSTSSGDAMSISSTQQAFRDMCNSSRQYENEHSLDADPDTDIAVFQERISKYDPLSSCLVDFQGRANMASVKNVQLMYNGPALTGAANHVNALHTSSGNGNGGAAPQGGSSGDEASRFVLQLGKATQDCFNMDYKHPLSMLQAFAICITRFDANLSWQ